MESLVISIPEDLKQYVEGHVQDQGYPTVSEYVVELLQADKSTREHLEAFVGQNQERLKPLILEGLNSGEPIPLTPEFWEERKRSLLSRVSATEPR